MADFGAVNSASIGRDAAQRARLRNLAEQRLRLWWTSPLALVLLFVVLPLSLHRTAEEVAYGLATACVILTVNMYYMKKWHECVLRNGDDGAQPNRPNADGSNQ